MKFLLDPNSKFNKVLSRIADFIILNFLWLIGSLLIFTLGTSTTSLCYCIRKLRKEGEIAIWKNFWKAYQSNFRKATILLAFILLIAIISILNFLFLFQIGLTDHILGRLLLILYWIFMIVPVSYLLPLQAQFENTVWQTIQNAWLISIRHLPYSIILSAINSMPLIIFLLSPEFFLRSLLFWIFGGISLIVYLSDIVLQKVFVKYK